MGEILPNRREQVLGVAPASCVQGLCRGSGVGAECSEVAAAAEEGGSLSHTFSPRRESI